MTQPNAYVVPLSYSTDQTPIRLIELPPALLDLVTSPNPPTLHFKSLPPHPNPTPANPQPHTYLCTPTSTFTIRQVSSSNNTFLLRHAPPPTSSSLSHFFTPPGSTPAPLGSVLTATTNSHLEVLPYTPNPVHTLRRLLPAYPSPTPLFHTRASLLSNVPLSPAQFDLAWRDSHAFETLLPTLDADGDSIERPCVWRLDPAMALKIVRMLEEYRLCEGLDWGCDMDAFREPFEDEPSGLQFIPEMLAVIIDNVRTSPLAFTARLALEVLAKEDMGVERFRKGWMELLPETMRGGVEGMGMGELEGLVKGWGEVKGGMVRFVEPAELLVVEGGAQKVVKRGKWHEKFAAQRK